METGNTAGVDTKASTNAVDTVVPRTAAIMPGTHERFMHVNVKWLSFAQIGVGIVCVILQIAFWSVGSAGGFLSGGFWAGAMFIAAGATGVVSSQRKTTCTIVAFLVTAVIAVVFTFGLLAYSGIEWSANHYHRRTTRPIAITMAIVSLAQAFLSIALSIYACHGICFGSRNQGLTLAPGQVQYSTGPDGEQQIVIVPVNPQAAAAVSHSEV